MSRQFSYLVFLSAFMSSVQFAGAAAEMQKLDDGIVVALPGARLRLQVCAENIIRVAYAPDAAFFERRSLAVLPRRGPIPEWALSHDAARASLRTAALEARVDLTSGAVTFHDREGNLILAERAGGRSLAPAEIDGERVLQARQLWEPNADESLYGLGQHQFGLMNLKGRDLDLWQRNTEIAVPVLVSSRGYGILWDSAARTRFGDLRDPTAIPPARLLDAHGRAGALTATYFADANFGHAIATRREGRIDISSPPESPRENQRLHPKLPRESEVSIRWEGEIVPDESGEYTLQPLSNGGLKIWVDDQLVVDHWRQGWLFWYDQARVRLEAGRRHRLRIDWVVDAGEPRLQLRWKTPSPDDATSLWSEAADGIDYYFIHGPQLDRVVAGYRQLTGPAPMMPVWAFGLWQSRERYQTQQQSLDVLARYRALGAPIDTIVQDWFYWRAGEWGAHEFDAARFPDPVAWIRAIHDDNHARVMLSVWPKFHEDTRNFAAMRERRFLYEPNLAEGIRDWTGFRYTFYDAFNPAARELFWAQINRELFPQGVDAWWLDATEPEMRHAPMVDEIRRSMRPTALGSAARVMLAYPLLNAGAVHDGQRAAAPDQRVFILTRSGYAGMQRYAAASWSGDIASTWSALRKQIPAGLSFALSGIPYWTTDSGGFAVPPRWSRRDENGPTPDAPVMSAEEADEWAELNTRWLQYATFCPLMRIHGQFPFRELWQFGGEDSPAYHAMLKCDRLRYRLLPYLYSLAGAVTHEGGTIMRALVMDFRADPAARDIGDQFMFGPALLVSPVTEYRARRRAVYLPASAGGWYDFWSGAAEAGGRTIDAAAPFDALPLHVRAGAIIPVGPERQYTTEKPADPITLWVYAGADGAFTLYEDDGLSNGYERGESARIPLRWDNASRTLTIGAREGSFPGMLRERTFEVVLVAADKAVGFSFTPQPDRPVRYSGEAVSVGFD